MTFTSIRYLKEAIFTALEACRRRTLDLFVMIEPGLFYQQAHPDFSPVGWHLGHIAFTESYWILEQYGGLPSLFPQYHQLFAANGLPKTERQNLPSPEVIQEYLETVRTKVLIYLETAPIDKQERLWRWLIQHECQHNEIICFILQLHDLKNSGVSRGNPCGYPGVQESVGMQGLHPINDTITNNMLQIPAGGFLIGSDSIEAQDNERPCHWLELDTYWIDTYPVTCGQYREFINHKGYQKSEFWSPEGWQWLQQNPVSQPLYWVDTLEKNNHPVYGVSWYEAEAYTNFVGKRLPTEAQWEKAASWDEQKQQKRYYPWGEIEPNFLLCNYDTRLGQTTPVNAYPHGKSFYGCYDMLGNIWEWTNTWFDGYSGFKSYPYRGYSQTYFDNQHRVLKGGSWATRGCGLRNSFRNWYHPGVRQVFAGFRCVK